MQPVVTIQNLNHYFGKDSLKKQILFDINLEISAGEIVILTGPSGSGKTTLLSLIGGLRSVQEGSLINLDHELNGANEEQLVQVRRYIGYIFQAHNLLPFMTARQNVQMAIELHDAIDPQEAQAKSEAILQAVGLGERINDYPENLSGGQKQRVAIARALVSHPKLVLADEPTAALDSQTGREVVNLMQQMAREQRCTILLVTHDHRILNIADRIIHMEDGRLLAAPLPKGEGILGSSG
ncbi:MAG: ATP-binding cassette domain-containing protein [Cyanobacteria bacterium CRU_2_1]|nr:ATP-binding cassette domain-containing protein [Cyanobacteria bacterium CRU_2_1]